MNHLLMQYRYTIDLNLTIKEITNIVVIYNILNNHFIEYDSKYPTLQFDRLLQE